MKFADTSWWVAWSLPDDSRHGEALAALHAIRPTEQVLTTNLVVGETWTYLGRKARHATAAGYLDRIDQLTSAGRLRVHRVSESEEAAAWRWLRRHDEREYSFVDATSFETMRSRRLREALAFDHDFSVAGFVELGG